LKEKKIDQLEHAGYAKDVIRRLIVLAEECSSNHQTRWTCGMQNICYKGTQDEVLEEAKRVAAEQYEVIGSTDRIPESMWVLNNIFPDILEELRKLSYYLEEPCGIVQKYSPLPDLRSTSNTKTNFNSVDTKLINFASCS